MLRLLADLQHLPTSITRLSHLRYLNLANNPLQEPTAQLAVLCYMTGLTRLDLAYCDIRELPAGLRLPRLQQLDLDGNYQLTRLPADLPLPSLQHLVLSHNNFQSLPDTLRLPSLVSIDLKSNNFV